jgi:hypothetical protein
MLQSLRDKVFLQNVAQDKEALAEGFRDFLRL